jgi:branched-chain amino acid transport system permease protein
MMHWTRSGDLIVMVVLGGMQAIFGPLIGALTFLLLEEGLSRVTDYSNLILGRSSFWWRSRGKAASMV